MSNIDKIQKINSLFFSTARLSELLGISKNAANKLGSRYVKNNLLVRIKRNMYALTSKWNDLKEEELMLIANFIQVPSYVSLISALSYHGISTQIQRDTIASISLKRSASFNPKTKQFNYYKTNKRLYFGFEKKNGIFIASPEKALADSVHISIFGKYAFDKSSIDFSKLRKPLINKIIALYPERTKQKVKLLCGI